MTSIPKYPIVQEELAAELLEIRRLVAASVEPGDLFLGLYPGATAAGPLLKWQREMREIFEGKDNIYYV